MYNHTAMFSPSSNLSLSNSGSLATNISASSTLTETVSIDYEDFTDSFLKCSTCLSLYEPSRRTPKLLPCSHTVCLSCLEQIAGAAGGAETVGGVGATAGAAGEERTMRCPVCRTVVQIPQGGVSTLPPSFIINKLSDLIARQRRDVVPKCARHAAVGTQGELMFCESCDEVFCLECSGGVHNTGATRGRRADAITADAVTSPSSSSTGLPGSSLTVGAVSGHIVIPFSVAIRRMSEILFYKTGLCVKNLDSAASAVTSEMNKLDAAAERCLHDANLAFEDIGALIEQRRRELGETVYAIRESKMRLLREQLNIIESEKMKVHNSCHGINHQVEVRNISSKISDLNEMLDTSSTLLEPRENSFMKFDFGHVLGTEQISSVSSSSLNDGARLGGRGLMSVGLRTNSDLIHASSSSPALISPEQSNVFVPSRQQEAISYAVADFRSSDTQGAVVVSQNEEQHGSACAMLSFVARALGSFGCIRVSRTYPALCTMDMPPVTAHLRTTVMIHTVDYHGNPKTTGGDPVCAELINSRREKVPVVVKDLKNGSYSLDFTANKPGPHILNVTIFDRCIKSSPHSFNVAEYIEAVKKIGSTGSGDTGFKQPVAAVMSSDGTIYVLDAGNSRIKVLTGEGRFLRHITGAGLDQRGATGMCVTSRGYLVVTNWRTKRVTTINPTAGEQVSSFSCDEFSEPTCVAVNSHGEIIVGDNGAGKVFLFNDTGTKLRTVGCRGDKPGQFKLINSLHCHNDEIIICDNRVQFFSRTGTFLRAFPVHGGTRAGTQYSGFTVDSAGYSLVIRSKSEKGWPVVEVYSPSREYLFDIDSCADKLKRPCGLQLVPRDQVIVVDLGNDCLKVFPYL